jgi:hypothetical protein
MTTPTSLTETQQKVLRILVADTHEKATITGANLAKRVGLYRRQGEDKGGMRQVIHALRVKGFPICASGRGYFYARTGEQLAKFINRMQARVISQEKALDGLKGSFHNVGKVHGDGKVEYVKRLPVRMPNGSVAYREFTIGADGTPVIPSGTNLV